MAASKSGSKPTSPSENPGVGLRINRYLADCGLGSRRACEKLVLDGRVSINGTVCRELSRRVSPDEEVRLDRKIIRARPLLYIAFHKPAGVVCSRSDERGRLTIYDRLPPEWHDADYVGRLDLESEGLLLLTNDGSLALRLTHPRHKVAKQYEVTLRRPFGESEMRDLLKGMIIEGRRAAVDSATLISPKKLKIVLSQGIKRQIRIMVARVGHEVERLVRVRFGPLALGRMKTGSSRVLEPSEVAALRKACGIGLE